MSLNLLVVEDDFIVAKAMADAAEEVGFKVVALTKKGEEAIDIALAQKPAAILMDIDLVGQLDGIDTAIEIQKQHACVVIFLSQLQDERIKTRIGFVQKAFFMPKPVTQYQLKTILPQVISALNHANTESAIVPQQAGNEAFKDSIIVKHDYKDRVLKLKTILFIEAWGNNCKIYIEGKAKPLIIGTPMGKVFKQIQSKKQADNFVQIHKSTVINLDFVKEKNGNCLVINGKLLDVSRTYRSKVFKAFASAV